MAAGVVAACGPSASAAPSATAAPTPSPSLAPSPSPSPTPVPSVAPSPTPSALTGAELRRLVGGLLVVGFRGMTVDEAGPIVDAIEVDGVGGVILFDRDQPTGGPRNVSSPDQVRRLVADLHDVAAGRRLIVAIDQEGGIVTRLSPAHGYPPVPSQAQVGQFDEEAARRWATALAGTLGDAGIDLNFAPVVDLNANPSNPAIGALDRSFSADPEVVTRLASVEIEAHRAAGVATCLKHFPGLGSATANTDFGVADVTDTWSERELEPFRALVSAGRADTIMAGHLVNRRLDPDHPASLSPAIVTDLLRGDIGWDGVVVTDDLGAAAITTTFGADEALALALEAGNDILLLANQQSFDPNAAGAAIDAIVRHVESGRVPVERLIESRDRIAGRFGT